MAFSLTTEQKGIARFASLVTLMGIFAAMIDSEAYESLGASLVYALVFLVSKKDSPVTTKKYFSLETLRMLVITVVTVFLIFVSTYHFFDANGGARFVQDIFDERYLQFAFSCLVIFSIGVDFGLGKIPVQSKKNSLQPTGKNSQNNLNIRIKKLEISNRYFLVYVSMLIVVATWLLLFIPEIYQNEMEQRYSVTSLRNIESSNRDLSRNAMDIVQPLNVLSNADTKKRVMAKIQKLKDSFETDARTLSAFDTSTDYKDVHSIGENSFYIYGELSDDLDSLIELIAAQNDAIETNLRSQLTAMNEEIPYTRVSSTITRVLVLALLIYLVKILLNIYRYNSSAAQFYTALDDYQSFEKNSAPESRDKIEKYMHKTEFGVEPRSLFDWLRRTEDKSK